MDQLTLPPESITNTLRVAEMVEGYGNLFEHKLRMPVYDTQVLEPELWEEFEHVHDGYLEQLLSRAEETHEGCLVWLGAKDRHGYGVVRRNNKNYLIHRLAWIINFGQPTKGLPASSSSMR